VALKRTIAPPLLAILVAAGCGPELIDDDVPFEPGRLHLNLTEGEAAPEQPVSLSVSSNPCDTIVSAAMAEKGRGPNEVGKDLTSYPFKLNNYLYAGEAWCSEFVAWVYRVAGHPFTGGSEGGWMLKGSTQIRSWFVSNKTFVYRNDAGWSSLTPSPGDYIRYNNSSGGHSGLVHSVSGTTLYTVEGNVSNQVKHRTISNWKSYSSIDGIGRLGLACGCATDADCIDSDPCTAGKCVGGSCTFAPIPGCCTTNAQCNDNNPCTTDSCVGNTCKNAPVQGCCTTDAQCNDNNPCTTDSCAGNTCKHTPITPCCTTDGQCDDNDPCTADQCVNSSCTHNPILGCCKTDGQCNDDDPCTTDRCVDHKCLHDPVIGNGCGPPPKDTGVVPGPDQSPGPGPQPQLEGALFGGCSAVIQVEGNPSALLLVLGMVLLLLVMATYLPSKVDRRRE
jgi:hypothetical protein